MLSEQIQKAINDQINAELYSSYLYLSMAAYFESEDLPGASAWMKAQAQEEILHASKFFHFVSERDGRVLLGAIDAPETSWDSPQAAFFAAHEHEHKVSGLINDLVTLAEEEKDRAFYNFLQWFVSEQVEEEASTWEVYRKFKLVGTVGSGLFMVDKELGARTFSLPTPGAGGE